MGAGAYEGAIVAVSGCVARIDAANAMPFGCGRRSACACVTERATSILGAGARARQTPNGRGGGLGLRAAVPQRQRCRSGACACVCVSRRDGTGGADAEMRGERGGGRVRVLFHAQGSDRMHSGPSGLGTAQRSHARRGRAHT